MIAVTQCLLHLASDGHLSPAQCNECLAFGLRDHLPCVSRTTLMLDGTLAEDHCLHVHLIAAKVAVSP